MHTTEGHQTQAYVVQILDLKPNRSRIYFSELLKYQLNKLCGSCAIPKTNEKRTLRPIIYIRLTLTYSFFKLLQLGFCNDFSIKQINYTMRK